MTDNIKRDQDGVQWISIAESARRLGTTTSVLKRIIGEHRIDFTNFGNKTMMFIQWHDFEKLVKEKIRG